MERRRTPEQEKIYLDNLAQKAMVVASKGDDFTEGEISGLEHKGRSGDFFVRVWNADDANEQSSWVRVLWRDTVVLKARSTEDGFKIFDYQQGGWEIRLSDTARRILEGLNPSGPFNSELAKIVNQVGKDLDDSVPIKVLRDWNRVRRPEYPYPKWAEVLTPLASVQRAAINTSLGHLANGNIPNITVGFVRSNSIEELTKIKTAEGSPLGKLKAGFAKEMLAAEIKDPNPTNQ